MGSAYKSLFFGEEKKHIVYSMWYIVYSKEKEKSTINKSLERVMYQEWGRIENAPTDLISSPLRGED